LKLAALALAVALAAGCGGAAETRVVAGSEAVDLTVLDRDPVALLPAGALAFGYLDAAALFRSPFGSEVATTAQGLVPLGPEAGFVPERDVVSIHSAAYTIGGADYCAVVSGTFDPEAIRRAAATGTPGPLGLPVTLSRYAESDVYTTGRLDFAVLTPHTVVAGSETGVRRALDRLRAGTPTRAVPAWMLDLATQKGTTMVFAADGNATAAYSAMPLLAFLGGVHKVRIRGDFEPPGLNLSGAITYPDHDSAEQGRSSLRQIYALAQLAGAFSAFRGITFPPLDVRAEANEVAFTMPVGDATVRPLLLLASTASRAFVGRAPRQVDAGAP
jgi:hypothetical protein